MHPVATSAFMLAQQISPSAQVRLPQNSPA
jgi:hypothetical protein